SAAAMSSPSSGRCRFRYACWRHRGEQYCRSDRPGASAPHTTHSIAVTLHLFLAAQTAEDPRTRRRGGPVPCLSECGGLWFPCGISLFPAGATTAKLIERCPPVRRGVDRVDLLQADHELPGQRCGRRPGGPVD